MRAKLLLIYILISIWTLVWCSNKVISHLEEVADPKVFKQFLRTRTNVLVMFMKAKDSIGSIYHAFKDAATEVRGLGTLITVDCSGQGLKLCRQQKAAPDSHIIRHYKDGKFHKVYDRKETTKSIVRFMLDPTGDIPWEEDQSGKTVIHLGNPKVLEKLLKKHKSALVMFYAPWCVYCRQMKPEFAAAAAIARSSNLGVLAAMDLVRPENSEMRAKYNITAFPTVYFFKNGEVVAAYEGDNKQDSILEFMKDPEAAKRAEVPWSEEESEVRHLTTENFDETIKENPSSLVMFYAPWCSHCKKLKPEWTKAATAIHSQQLPGIIAAVDCTNEPKLLQQFKIKGYPTIKYFKDGKFAFDIPNLRDMKKIVDFMRDPKEPPPPPPPEPNWADVPSEVIHLNNQNFKSRLRSKRHALVMFYAPWCGHCKSAKPEFEAAAEVLKEESQLAMAAVNCVDNAELCKSHGVDGYPTFKHFQYFKESSIYDKGRKMADFVKFFVNIEPGFIESSLYDDILTGTDKPPSGIPEESQTIMNEAINKNIDAEGWEKIVQVTDENYNAVLANHDHLFLFFHSNICSLCEDLKQVLAELNDNLDPSLGVVAACDVEKCSHVVNTFEIKSLPILKYFRSGHFVTDYSGQNTVTAFKKFLNDMKASKDEL